MIAMSLVISLARADVASEPESCPIGAEPVTAHAPYCTPGTCEGGCDAGDTCRSAGLCVIDEQRQCGGNASGDCTYQHVEALSACSSQADCAAGTCVVADRCAPEVLAPGAAGCGCTSGWSAATGFMLLALLPWVTRKRAR
jgi:hypothetical protein